MRVRCSNGFRPTNIVPRLEPLVVVRKRFPGDADGVGHAGDAAGDLVDLGQDRVGPLHRGGVGQLDVDEQVALILRGDKAGRRARHPPHGQPEQADVDHQHDHAQAQQLPDRPAVGRGDAVEEAVEAPEEPSPARR